MFAGPIFVRELLTTSREWQHFLMRSGYVAALFVLIYTAGQSTFGWKQAVTPGELARFGTLLFQLFAVVQLALVLFFSPLFAASRVAQEKDRQTLVLLLMTDLRDWELVIGKLMASLLSVATIVGVGLPVFCMIGLYGGVSLAQVLWLTVLCMSAGVAAGSWGSLVAFSREQTFQTLAVSVLGLMLYHAVVEVLVWIVGSASLAGGVIGHFNPFRGLGLIVDPLAADPTAASETIPAGPYVLAMLGLAVILNGITIAMLRIWNPSRSAAVAGALKTEEDRKAVVLETPSRRIWELPILWRETMTRAYGRRMILIKLAYLVVFAIAALYVWQSQQTESALVLGLVSPVEFAFVALSFVSLLLVNAQGVTALTSERDAKTLELLLVTDVTAKEFIFGKLCGVLFNCKEVILLPLLGLLYFAFTGNLFFENVVFVFLSFLTLVSFAAMLGIHAGLTYDSSRTAIANALGTMFFLFLGIFICILLIVEARSSFVLQLPSFLVFILGGSLGLWASLTHKNPSPALSLAAGLLPFFTFYAITGYLLKDTLAITVVVCGAYGFTTIAMIVPAVSEFDVALGRTSVDKG